MQRDVDEAGEWTASGRVCRTVGLVICASWTLACSGVVDAPGARLDNGATGAGTDDASGMDASIPRWPTIDSKPDRIGIRNSPDGARPMDASNTDTGLEGGQGERPPMAEAGADDDEPAPVPTTVATGCAGAITSLSATSAGDMYAPAEHLHNMAAFGYSIGLFGDLLLVTAPFKRAASDVPIADSTGALFGTRRDAETFGPLSLIGPADARAGDGVLSAGTERGHVPLLQHSSPSGQVSSSGNYAVTMVNGRVILGVPTEDTDGAESGAVYVFEERAGAWVQTQRFKAPMPRACSFFGSAVAADADVLVVSAFGEGANGVPSCTTPHETRAGAAYVYRHDGTGYAFEQRLVAPNETGGALFGWSVAVSKGEIAIGAFNETNSTHTLQAPDTWAYGSGAVYIFHKNTSWQLAHYLKPDVIAVDGNQSFGASLAFTDGELLVGAAFDPICSGAQIEIVLPNEVILTGGGAVYVLDRRDYSQRQCLYGGAPARIDTFGWSLAVDGDRLFVSAPLDASGDPADPANGEAPNSGAIYAFERQEDGLFRCASYVKPPPGTGANQHFGYSLAAASGLVAVGSPHASRTDFYEPGAVHLYRFEPTP